MRTQSIVPSLLLLAVVAVSSQMAFAQLGPTNDKGATIGHVHFLVPDPEMHKKLWVDLFGAQVARVGALELLKLPGIIILINKGDPSKVSGAPTADHFALRVRDLDAIKKKLASASIRVSDKSIAEFPHGARVELIEEKNLQVPVAFHHFHIFSAGTAEITNWYTKYFGIKFPDGPNFPGGEMFFTAQPDPPRVPTKDHVFDHISFEVKGLHEFCKILEDQGIKLDMKIIEAPQIGLRVTFVTDPIGTRIELTEGLAEK
jgi:catechol 2,3-dioxygenase-like lactoylglutathione lyase family enzyme